MSIYEENGYANRREYMDAMAEDYGQDRQTVYLLADLLGPSEDFDGLISGLEDMQELDRPWREELPKPKSKEKKSKARHSHER